MTEFIKKEGPSLLVKVLVGIGFALLVYWGLEKYLFNGFSNLTKVNQKTDSSNDNLRNDNQQDITKYPDSTDINSTTSSATDNATNTPISREQLAEGLIALQNKDIAIPDNTLLSEYEGIISSSTLTKEQVAGHVAGDSTNPEYTSILGKLVQAGPAFIMRGGDSGLIIYAPYLKNVLDNDLVALGQNLVRVNIDSITNKDGKNILDVDSPFEQNTFFNKLSFERVPAFAEESNMYYKAERALRLKGDQVSIVDDVKKISGSLIFNLPISVEKYDLSLDQIVTKVKIKAGNTTVSVSDILDGAVSISIKGNSKSVVYVKCFNSNNQIIASSMITALDPEQFVGGSFTKQSILNFSLADSIDHIEIYAPSQVVTKKYSFEI